MNIKSIITSKKFRIATLALVALCIMLMIFQAGVIVGYKKALFSRGLGDNYSRAYGDPDHDRGGFFGAVPGDNLTSSHGAVGKIVRITPPTLVVASPDNVEKIITITDDTTIRKSRNEISQANLAIGDFIVVLGEPDNASHIVARLIRVLLAPSSSTASTSTSSIKQ